MNQLEMKKAPSGQWMYRVFDSSGVNVKVDWQYGSFDKEETKQQANDRFGPFSVTKIKN